MIKVYCDKCGKEVAQNIISCASVCLDVHIIEKGSREKTDDYKRYFDEKDLELMLCKNCTEDFNDEFNALISKYTIKSGGDGRFLE